MRNRIWAELTQTKHNLEFASLYSERQRLILRIYNISILIFSSGGVMGWKLWDNLPLLSCVIIAFVSLFRLIQPHLIINEKQLMNLDEIHKFYSEYFNKIEKLWFEHENKKITTEQATNIFFKHKNTEVRINKMVASTIKNKPNSILKRCKENSDNYFNQIFNN